MYRWLIFLDLGFWARNGSYDGRGVQVPTIPPTPERVWRTLQGGSGRSAELMEDCAMWEDPIVAEVRRVRAAHAARFNNDLTAIYRDLKQEEQKSGRLFESYPARRIAPVKKSRVQPA